METSRILSLVHHLLLYRRASSNETAGFEGMRHNADLCPAIQQRVENILQLVGKYQRIVYDVQGPSDGGTDVVLRLGGDDGEAVIVGFQVKAADEIGPGIYQLLKAQYVDAQSRFRDSLAAYYVVLCWPIEGNYDRIRNVENALVGLDRVFVIEPAYAWTFLESLSSIEMGAVAAAILAEGDPLVDAARTILASKSPTEQLIVIKAIEAETRGISLTLGDLTNDQDLREARSVTSVLELDVDVQLPVGTVIPDRFRVGGGEPVPSAAEVDHLEDLLVVDESGRISADVDGLSSLRALAYEVVARYGYGPSEVIEHLTTSLAFRGFDSGGTHSHIGRAIAESIYFANLAYEVSVEILIEFLKVNYSDVEDCAEQLWDLEDGESMTWSEIAEDLIREVEADESGEGA